MYVASHSEKDVVQQANCRAVRFDARADFGEISTRDEFGENEDVCVRDSRT